MGTTGTVNPNGNPYAEGISGLMYRGPDRFFAWGDRLHAYHQPVSGLRSHSELGRFASNTDDATALSRQTAKTWELEIVLRARPDDHALRRMIGYAVDDESLVEDLVRAHAREATKRATAIRDADLQTLAGHRAHRLDLLVGTVWIDEGFQFCTRVAQAFWTDDWLLTIWKPAGGEGFLWDLDSPNARSAALPARRRSHLPDDPPRRVGGPDALIRLAYFVAGHHEWSVGVIGETLERWQSEFFESSADGQHDEPLRRMPRLSEVGRAPRPRPCGGSRRSGASQRKRRGT